MNLRLIMIRGAGENPPPYTAGSLRPGPVRPARPARCRAEAWLMRFTSSDGSPVHGESLAIRASPESITARTPSIVIELSAMFVERISFRCARRRHRQILLRRRQIAIQRRDQQSRRRARPRTPAPPPDLRRARQKHQHIARIVAANHSTAAATCSSSGAAEYGV